VNSLAGVWVRPYAPYLYRRDSIFARKKEPRWQYGAGRGKTGKILQGTSKSQTKGKEGDWTGFAKKRCSMKKTDNKSERGPHQNSWDPQKNKRTDLGGPDHRFDKEKEGSTQHGGRERYLKI